MRVTMTTLGSRGDVQPFVALGGEMKSRGHDVNVAAPAIYADLVHEAGLGFAPLPGDPGEFLPGKKWDSLGEADLAARLGRSTSAIPLSRALRVLPEHAREDRYQLVRRLRSATQGADLVVNAVLTRPFHLFTDDSTPWAAHCFLPQSSTGAFPAFGAPALPFGSGYNRLTHLVREQWEWHGARRSINEVRRAAGYRPLGLRSPLRSMGRERPILYPFSPSLVRPPADWPERCHVTGFWFWDRPWEPSAALRSFVEEGAPPVVFTMGSLWPVHRRFGVLRMALEAARKAGRRMVFVGSLGEERLPGDVFHVAEADYRWLFPRAACVIHHGGLGTTAEVLRAGVPQMCLPALVDQPFWAARTVELGVASSPVPLPELTASKFAASAAQCLTDKGLADRAVQVARQVRAEAGVARAAEALEAWISAG